MSDFELVVTTAGAVSIRNNVVNEIMHNPVGPWREANDLYIDQSDLRGIMESPGSEDLVLFDVGLGAASNAIAAIDAVIKLPVAPIRKLHVVSYENNLELLRFTIQHADAFEHLRGYADVLQKLLDVRYWSSPCGRIKWDLKEGDFQQLMGRERLVPDLVFYDPYSPAVNQDMWTLKAFKNLFACCTPANSHKQVAIYTYSVSTPVRSAMLLAGFYVGHGRPTGLKKETTQFATDASLIHRPLGLEWFGRWVRSQNQWPFDVDDDSREDARENLQRHPQMSPWSDQAGELIKAAFPGRY
jgi:S-adenosyl-L-methionine-dependent methyltransferase